MAVMPRFHTREDLNTNLRVCRSCNDAGARTCYCFFVPPTLSPGDSAVLKLLSEANRSANTMISVSSLTSSTNLSLSFDAICSIERPRRDVHIGPEKKVNFIASRLVASRTLTPTLKAYVSRIRAARRCVAVAQFESRRHGCLIIRCTEVRGSSKTRVSRTRADPPGGGKHAGERQPG